MGCAGVYEPKKAPCDRVVRWSERRSTGDLFSAHASMANAPSRLFIDSRGIKVHRWTGGRKGGCWLTALVARTMDEISSSMLAATVRSVLSFCSGCEVRTRLQGCCPTLHRSHAAIR